MMDHGISALLESMTPQEFAERARRASQLETRDPGVVFCDMPGSSGASAREEYARSFETHKSIAACPPGDVPLEEWLRRNFPDKDRRMFFLLELYVKLELAELSAIWEMAACCAKCCRDFLGQERIER